jgi:MtN3 and saliva related transmembrane protein
MHEYIEYFIELVFGIGMFLNAILFVPQALKIYKTKNTAGLSLATFAGFNIIQLFTIFHGYLHKDYILMFGNVLACVLCGIVTVLLIKYKKIQITN